MEWDRGGCEQGWGPPVWTRLSAQELESVVLRGAASQSSRWSLMQLANLHNSSHHSHPQHLLRPSTHAHRPTHHPVLCIPEAVFQSVLEVTRKVVLPQASEAWKQALSAHS